VNTIVTGRRDPTSSTFATGAPHEGQKRAAAGSGAPHVWQFVMAGATLRLSTRSPEHRTKPLDRGRGAVRPFSQRFLVRFDDAL
jgi:hypothetical protein